MSRLKRIYHPDAYDTGRPVGSYWEDMVPAPPPDPALEGDIRADVAIIGAGFTGLSAAWHLARNHGFAPVVLEAGQVGWGASGRNAGFNCMGGGKITDRAYTARWGQDDLAEFYKAQRRATDCVAEIVEAAGLDVDRQPGGEWLLAHKPSCFDGFAEEAAFLEKVAGVRGDVVPADALRARGIQGAGFAGALFTEAGFALNPRKYVFGLAQAARAAGVRIFGDSAVTGLERRADGRFALRTARGTVVADRLILAGNGYNSENLPDWIGGRYLPVVSHIMVTEPISADLQAEQGWQVHQMAYDSRKMLHYFRLLPDGRMLFGMRGTANLGPRDRRRMPQAVRADFEAMFPVWRAVPTAFHWSGLICVARNLVPYVGPIPDWAGAYTALAYHGNGVSMASYCGRVLADMLATGAASDPVPEAMRSAPGRYPFARWRRWGLPLAFRWYHWQDR